MSESLRRGGQRTETGGRIRIGSLDAQADDVEEETFAGSAYKANRLEIRGCLTMI